MSTEAAQNVGRVIILLLSITVFFKTSRMSAPLSRTLFSKQHLVMIQCLKTLYLRIVLQERCSETHRYYEMKMKFQSNVSGAFCCDQPVHSVSTFVSMLVGLESFTLGRVCKMVR